MKALRFTVIMDEGEWNEEKGCFVMGEDDRQWRVGSHTSSKKGIQKQL